jgi:type IV pilus assembly protein PilB
LAAPVQKNFLGTNLVAAGIITQEQLDNALNQQIARNARGTAKGLLGQMLVELGYCTDDDIARVMARKSGVAFMSLNSYPVDMTAANLITPELAEKYKALPMGFEKNKLLVAMMNPNDIIAIDDLRILTGNDIQAVVVPDKELEAAIKQFSSMSSKLDSGDVEDNTADDTIDTSDSNEQPAVQLANQIFNQSINAGASDVHIEPQEKKLRIRFRIDGVLHEMLQPPHRLHASLVSRIKVMANMDIAERRIPQDGRITMRVDAKTVDIRVASLPSAYGEKITLRLLNRSDRLITLEELGFPQKHLKKYNNAIHLPYGFVLITGPTGSGKSTTLYASLAQLNSPDKNIITLEDPIERRMDGLNQVQVNVKAGMTFASGLRSILRNDPDIIMVGEIRDQETAKIAVESALTGHLVLSTLHTNDSAGAVTRLADMGIEPYLTASSLIGVVSQRLIRVLCPSCKKAYNISRDELLKTIPDFPLEKYEQTIELYHSKGCIACNGTGYKGRKGVYEFLPITETLQKLILEHASMRDIKAAAIAEGMDTLRMDGLLKVKQGLTTIEELLRVIV